MHSFAAALNGGGKLQCNKTHSGICLNMASWLRACCLPETVSESQVQGAQPPTGASPVLSLAVSHRRQLDAISELQLVIQHEMRNSRLTWLSSHFRSKCALPLLKTESPVFRRVGVAGPERVRRSEWTVAISATMR